MKKLLLLFMFLFPHFVQGQETEYYLFRESGILNPFLSEIRSPTVKAELAFLNKLDYNYYKSNYTDRPFIEVHLGTQLPLFYMVNHQKNFKFSTSGYIGNILLIDMFEEITAPVINTDYFFGIQASFLKYLDHPYIKNAGLKLVPVFHESTHIGDEFSLHGYTTIPDFRRVNISYEAWEIAAVINDPENSRNNLISAKIGFHRLWNPTKGYYTTDSIETKERMAPPSQKNFEYYIQMNWQRTNGFLCSDTWMNIFSIEANNRLKFSYDTDIEEERTWNVNLYFGWKYLAKDTKRNMGLYLRYYNGIIPNGQFRNTGGFQYIALCIAYN